MFNDNNDIYWQIPSENGACKYSFGLYCVSNDIPMQNIRILIQYIKLLRTEEKLCLIQHFYQYHSIFF